MDLLAALEKDFIIGDGGVGVMLAEAGLAAGECGEAWNLERPDRVEAVHRAFVEAGSELIQTNTFQGNRLALARHGLVDNAAEINRAAVGIARRAAGDRALVAASMGPTGGLLEPYGELTPPEVQTAFAEQAAALAEAGAQALIVETFAAVEEAEIAVGTATATGLPVIASMAFEKGGATVMGVKPETAAQRLAAAGADVVGANCGVGPAELFPIIEKLRAAHDGLIIAQPNAGMPQVLGDKTVFPATPETMAEYAVRFRDLGVKIIGGCCGTRPEHIAAMAKALRG